MSNAPEGSFDAFAAAQIRPLARFGALLTGDRGAGEDLTQDVLARMSLRWSRIDSPAAYARTAMVRAHLRRLARPSAREVPTAPELLHEAAHPEPEDRSEMWAALQSLPRRQRAVLVLRYYEGLSEAEIAQVLGCAPGTVKSQASKGLRHLRAALDTKVEAP